MTTEKKVSQLVNAQTETQAMQVYSALRIELASARRAKADHAAGLMKVMAMAGDALEARIGVDRFDALIDQVDAQIYA